MSKLVGLVLAVCLGLSGAGCTGCATALLEGTLVADGQGGLAVRGDGGRITPVRWPGDAHVTRDGDHLALANTLGSVFAREGESVSMGGGMVDDVTFGACGPIVMRASPASTR